MVLMGSGQSRGSRLKERGGDLAKVGVPPLTVAGIRCLVVAYSSIDPGSCLSGFRVWREAPSTLY